MKMFKEREMKGREGEIKRRVTVIFFPKLSSKLMRSFSYTHPEPANISSSAHIQNGSLLCTGTVIPSSHSLLHTHALNGSEIHPLLL